MSFERATEAFRKGAFGDAIASLTDVVRDAPARVDAHLLLARCFLAGGQHSTAFQVRKALILSPEIRRHAPLPADEMSDLLADTLLGWAEAIEKGDFPKGDVETFGRAVEVCAALPGSRPTALKDLLEGLRQRRYVAAMLSDAVRRPR
jgi:hypothetical protein